MATKTIYVSDTELPVFERAQELAGTSLSGIIVQALRRFIANEEYQREGLRSITLRVGPPGAWKEVRFYGRLLARWQERVLHQPMLHCLRVYKTAKGHFALYSKNEPNWTYWAEENSEYSQWLEDNTNRSLEVYDSLENLKNHIPQELYMAVEWTLANGSGIEELDI